MAIQKFELIIIDYDIYRYYNSEKLRKPYFIVGMKLQEST